MLDIPWVVNAQAGQTVTTQMVIIDATTSDNYLISVGQLVKNGVVVGSSATFAAGDQLSVQVAASAGAGQAQWVAVTGSYDVSSFAVVTAEIPERRTYANMQGHEALDLTYYPNTAPFRPNSAHNALIDLTDSKTYNLNYLVGQLTPAASILVLNDAFNNRVLFIDEATRGLLHVASFAEKPRGPFLQRLLTTDVASFALYKSGQVVCIELVGFTQSLATAYAPTSACTSAGKTAVTDDVFLNILGGPSYNLGHKTRKVVSFGDNWAVSTDEGVYLVVGGVVSLALPGFCRDLCSNGQYVFAVQADRVVRIDASGTVLSSDLDVPSFPVSVSANASQVAVGAFNNKVYLFSTDLTAGAVVPCNDPYGVSLVNTLFAASLYYNRPDPTYPVNKTPLAFDLSDPVKSARNTLLTSNTFVVELPPAVTVIASVPALYGMSIVKNGVAAGTSVPVSEGDTLAVKVLTPASQNTQVRAPLAVGAQHDYLQTETLAYDVTPTYFKLADVKTASADTVTSEETTISGLDGDQSAYVSVSAGTLYKNGLALTASYAQFANGDKLKISILPGNPGETKYVVITIGTANTYWAVTSTYDADQKYLPESLLFTDEQLLPVSGNTDSRKLFRVKRDLTGASEVDLGGSYSVPSDGTPAIVVADRRAGLLHSVTQSTFLPQASVSVPGLVSSDVVPKVFSVGADYTMMAVTSTQVRLLDKDFKPLWTVNTPTSTLDALFVGANILYLLDGVGYSKYRVDLTTGALTFVWSQVGSFSRFYYAQATDKSEWAFVVGPDGIVLVADTPVQISSTSVVNLAIDPDNQVLWAFDRYAGDLLSFDFTGNLLRTQSLYFVAGDLLYAGALYAADLSGKRLVKFDSSLQEAASIPTTDLLVDLTFDADYLYGLECLSTVLPTNFLAQSSADFSFADSTDVALNALTDSVTQKIDSAAAVRPRQVSVPPISGAQIVLNGSHVGTSAVIHAGDTVGLEVTSSGDYLETTSLGLHLGDGLYNWNLTTVPNLIPDYLQFAGQFGLVIDSEARTEALAISGLSAGRSTVLTLDPGTTEGYLLINGIAAGVSASVSNGDTVALAVKVQGIYGFAHTYTVGANGVTVGSVRLTTKLLADPFVRPEQEDKDGQSFIEHGIQQSVQESKSSVGMPLQDEWYLCASDTPVREEAPLHAIKSLAAEVENFNRLLRVLPSAQSVARHSFAAPSKSATYVRTARALENLGTAGREETALRTVASALPSVNNRVEALSARGTPVKHLYTPRKIAADYAYRLLNYSAVSAGLPFRERAHMALVQATRLDAKHLDYDSFFEVGAQYESEAGITHSFDRWAFDRLQGSNAEFAHNPVRYFWSDMPVGTDWNRGSSYRSQSVSAHYARLLSATYSEQYAEYSQSVSDLDSSALNTGRRAARSTQVAAANRVQHVVHAQPRANLGHATHYLGNENKILISGYSRAQQSSARSWAKLSPRREVVPLRASARYAMKLLLTPLWVEPTLTAADALGIFETREQAQADADSKAVNPTHVTAFHTHFFWYQDPTVANKVCMTVGSMDRTPYRWNMQVDNVFAADKLSWYISGG